MKDILLSSVIGFAAHGTLSYLDIANSLIYATVAAVIFYYFRHEQEKKNQCRQHQN